MANNPVVNSITFAGGVAGQASVQAQGIAGNLTFLLPNTAPITGQLLDVQAVNGNNVFLGWVSAGTESISLGQILQSGATTNQTIIWNGTAWVPSSALPGEGTVTSVAVTVPAWLAVSGSPITTAGTIAITSAPSLTANWVLATPNGSAGVLAPRALVANDIPSLPYLSNSTQLPVTKAFTASQWLDSYTSSSGVFTSSQPNFTDLAGSIATGQILASTITIAQINSKVGNGNAVQLSNTGQTINAGDVLTYDVNGNVQDSGTLLSSLATTSSLSAYALKTGTVFSGNVEVETSLLLDVSLTDNASSTGSSGQVLTAGTGGHVVWSTNISGNAASITGSITESQVTNLVSDLALKAPLASPTFTGIVSSTHVQATSGSDLLIDALSTNGVRIADNGNARGILVGGTTAGAGHIWLWSPAGSSLVDVSDTGTAISGASSFTSANPTFFSAQGNGSKVQLSTGTTTTGDVVTYDANGNTVDSSTLLSSLASTASVTAKPNLYTISGAAPASTDNHIASGTVTLNGVTPVTVTLTGSATFTSTATYVVQVSYNTAPSGTPPANIYATLTDGANFNIVGTDAADTTSTIAWTAIGF